MSDNPVYEGGCLCGTIRYRIAGPIAWAAHCHCAMCRRASGAVALTWAKSRLSWLRLDDHLVAYAVSTPADKRPAIGGGDDA